MVAEVGVHVDEELVVMLDGIAHSRQDRGAQSELPLAVENVDARVRAGQLVGKAAGAVGRIVIDYENIGGRRDRMNLPDQRRQVVALVVRRDRDQDSGRSGGGRHRNSFPLPPSPLRGEGTGVRG